MLVNGRWSADWQPVQASDGQGGFVQPDLEFSQLDHARRQRRADGRRRLCRRDRPLSALRRVDLPLGFAHADRAQAQGLERSISVSIVEPALTDQGWRFGDYPGADRDTLNGATYLHEIYTRADPNFTGRATVRCCGTWRASTIVNNESADILRMFNSGFGALADARDRPLSGGLAGEDRRAQRPHLSRAQQRRLSRRFRHDPGGPTRSVREVFAALDELEARLEGPAIPFRRAVTESDIRVFVTLVRFDAAYHGLFKCNLRRIADYPRLSAYLSRMLDAPGVRETVTSTTSSKATTRSKR